MKKLKIGDTVTCTLFGGEKYTGTVEDIQICREGMKEGRSVKTCDLDKHENGVIDMPEHWCYFYQIKYIQSN